MRTFLFMLFLSGIILLNFTACKDEDKIQDLLLSKTSVTVEEGDNVVLYIESGNGGYVVSSSQESIVTAGIVENSIVITGLTQGAAIVTIKDGANKSCPIEVTVISYAQGDNTPRFKWDDYIGLEQVNNWSLTVSENQIGVTNVFERKQYIVAWNGNLSDGIKSEPSLRIVELDKETQVISLTKLAVINEENNCCFITFQDDSRRGELVFTK